jgi:hypothetical protein
MMLQQNKGTAKASQTDLPASNTTLNSATRTTITNSFPDFTIPKDLFKNILNGNVRSQINEYLYRCGIWHNKY